MQSKGLKRRLLLLSCFSRVRLFETPWPPCPLPTPRVYSNSVGDAIQPSHPLSPLLLPPSIFPRIRVFSNESVLRIRWPKNWSFSFNISPSPRDKSKVVFGIDAALPGMHCTLNFPGSQSCSLPLLSITVDPSIQHSKLQLNFLPEDCL